MLTDSQDYSYMDYYTIVSLVSIGYTVNFGCDKIRVGIYIEQHNVLSLTACHVLTKTSPVNLSPSISESKS